MTHNFTLNGDEARGIMMMLATSHSKQLSSSAVISLWIRLNEISTVQPPKQQSDS